MKRIFGLRIEEKFGIDTWHKDVRFFQIYDEQGEERGAFYLDLYARENKRGGAWMDASTKNALLMAAYKNLLLT